MSRTACALVLAAFALAPAPANAAPPVTQIETGRLIEAVATKADPEQTYALYLPAAYSPERTWPTLFLFDARKSGVRAAERFVAAAERYGWILIASNFARSDEAMAPNLVAMKAMYTDAVARYAVDRKRLYASGYSGGARAAVTMGLLYRGEVAGVIGASGGFPFDVPPKRDNPFAFFGTAGDRDFNYYELRELDATLAGLGVPHRLAIFDGVHEWPPEPTATRAIEWMELRAQKDGQRAADPTLVSRLFSERTAAARTLESSSPTDAAIAWREITEDFAGLVDTAAASREADRLGRQPAVIRELAEREKRDRRDRETIRRDRQALLSVPDDEVESGLGRLIATLRIAELKKKEATGSSEERLSAARILATLAGQTGFYQPSVLFERKEWPRAALMLGVATVIRPDDAWLWFALAQARAQAGSKKRALEALATAIERGLTGRAEIENEPLLAPLRSEAEYRALVEKLPQRPT